MSADFASIAEDYIAGTNRRDPGAATGRGFHEHDNDLPDRAKPALDARQAEVGSLLARIEGLDRSRLEATEPYDAEFLERRLRWEMEEHEAVRAWQRSPSSYLGSIGASCNNLVIRDFAPLEERLQSLVSRLRQTPRLLDQARANLLDPSTYAVDNAIESGTGLRALFLRDLPEAAANAAPESRAAVEAACGDALAAVDAFVEWLKVDLRPKATPDFAWGRDTFADLLKFNDSIEDPIESLIRRGEEDLRAHQARLVEVAATIDPRSAPAEVVDRVSLDHPAADQLLPATDALLESLRQFSIDAGLCTMPTEVRIRLTETPGYSRMTTQAACSPPGPFEKVATEAYYYVTPPDAAWPPERTEAYLKFFNRWSIPGVTAHEAYPGHYVHLAYLQRAESRRAASCAARPPASKAGPHYIEQVMVEAGYGDGNPRYDLMQIREALLRLCRYRCAFGLHAEGWSVQQAVDFFTREGYSHADNRRARDEARRPRARLLRLHDGQASDPRAAREAACARRAPRSTSRASMTR